MTDWLLDLTDDDLGTLVEALKAWETKDVAGEMMGDLFTAMMCDNPEAKIKMDAERLKEKQTRERAKALRKERSIVLRAKLLMLRDRRRVESVIRTVGDVTR